MDVHAQFHVSAFCHLQGLGVLQSVACGTAEGSHEEIRVGKGIAGAPFKRLLVAEVLPGGRLLRIGGVRHVQGALPSQRHANERGAVAQRPAE